MYVQASALKMQARVYRRVSTVRLRGRHPPCGGGPPTERGLAEKQIMTDEEPGLENAIKHMEAALECLVDPKDQVVAMRLSHALDLARERLLEGADKGAY